MTTVRLTKLRRQNRKNGAINTLIAPIAWAASDEGSEMLTKRGDVFTVLKLEGLDAECMEPEDIERVTNRFESVLKVLGPEYRITQYLIKRNEAPIPGDGDVVRQSRIDFLKSKSHSIYTIDLYLLIHLTPGVSKQSLKSLLDRLSIRKALKVSRAHLDRTVNELRLSVDGLCTQLRGTVKPQVLNREETLEFLRSLTSISPHKAKVHGSVPKYHLDQYLAISNLHCWPQYFKQDDHFMKFLAVADPPSRTFPNMLRLLPLVKANMIVCSEFKRESHGVVRKAINKIRRHYHLAKSSMMNTVLTKDPRPDEVLIDDSKTAVVDELNNALKEMEVHENYFGRFSMTIKIFDQDLAKVNAAVSKVTECFALFDSRVVEEDYNMLNSWASMIPGNHMYALRHMWLMNVNYAHMSFLFRPATQGAEALANPFALLETQAGTLFNLFPKVTDVGHAVALGSTGSGKSFLMNFLTSCYQSSFNPYTMIMDLGGSYRRLTEHYGGSYLHVGKASKITINPFALPLNEQNIQFQFSLMRLLVEINGDKMTTEQTKDLYDGINELYVLKPEHRTLSHLAKTCHKSYKARFDEWIGSGRLSRYFDNVEDNLTMARFQCFDFEDMENPEALEPVLFYVLHRANAVIYDRSKHDLQKLVIFDEAWRFFSHPVTRAYIHEALKTWRKSNGSMILATQSADDLRKSELLSTITESCMTQYFLANPGMDDEEYRKAFNVRPTEAEWISRLQKRQEFLFKQNGLSKVLALNPDPVSFRIFTNSRSEESNYEKAVA